MLGEARDGVSAIAACQKFSPKLVCLDVQMPDGNGLDVLKEIRAALPKTRVLMVTGSTDRETVQAAISMGASGYVVKPFNIERVVYAVKQASIAPVADASPAEARASDAI